MKTSDVVVDKHAKPYFRTLLTELFAPYRIDKSDSVNAEAVFNAKKQRGEIRRFPSDSQNVIFVVHRGLFLTTFSVPRAQFRIICAAAKIETHPFDYVYWPSTFSASEMRAPR